MQNTNMKLLLLLHFLQLLFLSATRSNTLYTGQSLTLDQTLTSTNGIFQLGFLEQSECGSSFISYNSYRNDYDYYNGYYCICIWYSKLPSRTQVWCIVAASGLSSQLVITHGNLQVRNDTDSFFIWSSSHFNSTKLVLEDTGNLVLSSLSNTTHVFWQSFDHTTDTWLPGAKIGFDKLSISDHFYNNTIDTYSFELDNKTLDAILLKDRDTTYGTCRLKGSSFICSLDLSWYIGETEVLLLEETNISYVSNEHESYFTYTVTNPTILIRFVIGYGQLFIQLVWSEEYQDWMPNKVRLSDTYCDQFAVYNNKRDYLHSSKCSPAIEFVSSAWQPKSITHGSKVIQCHEGDRDGFLLIHNAAPTAEGIFPPVSPNGCKRACLEDCNCTAYIEADICVTWNVSISNAILTHVELDLYIRLATTKTRKPKSQSSPRILAAIIGGISLTVALGCIIRKYKSREAFEESSAMETPLTAFKHRDLQQATKNFTSKLGEGGFGFVYKGTLPSSSHSIAVKKLKVHLQGEKQFHAEIRTLGIINHVNLVQLKGFCVKGTHKFLVYDYMPHGSLDNLLFGRSPYNLDWRTRYQIALGVAKGLVYLHDECRERIIHCDIKPENILLDAAFNPKIADFGLAKLLGRDFSRVLTTMRGTRGYLAPEWISGIEITEKADVYSYGMMLFELVSGKRNWSLRIEGEDDDYTPHQVMQRLSDDEGIMALLDNKLEGNTNPEEVARICKVAGWCIQDDEQYRPSMAHIVQILEGNSEVIIPPMPRFLQYMVDNDIAKKSQDLTSLNCWVNSGNRTESSEPQLNYDNSSTSIHIKP